QSCRICRKSLQRLVFTARSVLWSSPKNMFLVDIDSKKAETTPIRVLLLDDRPDLLILRSAILRQNGYEAITSSSIEEAESKLEDCDIAILDYHLGQGKFGTTVAESLREKRPQ